MSSPAGRECHTGTLLSPVIKGPPTLGGGGGTPGFRTETKPEAKIATKTLHLVRRKDDAPPPEEAVAAGDSILVIDELPAATLVDLVFAHERVITW